MELAVATAAIDADAREFGHHMRQGGWRLGLLVARSVAPGKGHGGDRKSDQRFDRNVEIDTKVSASEFANLSGTSAKRVMAHLRAWNKAAKDGHVPHSSELEPGQELPNLHADRIYAEWGDYYDASEPKKRGDGQSNFPPPSPPRSAESELVDMPGPFCGYPTAGEQIDSIEVDLEFILGPRYKLKTDSLVRLEEVLETALEGVRNYGKGIKKGNAEGVDLLRS